MADIKKIAVGKKVLLEVEEGVTWAYVVGKTAKRVWVQVYQGTKYIKDEEGNPIKKLVDPKRIKLK
jgi:hypothetical protein